MASQKEKETSQDKLERKDKRKRIDESIEHCTHVLSVLLQKPEMWCHPTFRTVRECIQVMKANPQQFPPVIGDNTPDGTAYSDNNAVSGRSHLLRPVTFIAQYKDVDVALSPILQVVSATMKYESSTEGKKSNSIHFTHLRLCDGSNDVMVGRLSMHISHEGNKLRPGDIIQLDVFTPLRFTPSGENDGDHRLPAVVIHNYSRIGYAAPRNELNNPIHCVNVTDSIPPVVPTPSDGAHLDDGMEPLIEVTCTAGSRYCSLYGVNAVVCICDANPPSKIDLEIVHQFCYFATTDVQNMNNKKKRNMLYWWFMTNHYNICGKGNRKKPPACLLAAIQKAYPEANGRYVPYEAK